MAGKSSFFSKIFAGLKRFLRRVELPHRKVLILAAICISSIAIVIAYRFKDARETALALANQQYGDSLTADIGTTDQALAADQRIADALAQTQAADLGPLGTSTNPFDPSPKDSISDRFTKDIIAAYGQYVNGNGSVSTDNLGGTAINDIDTSFLPRPRYTSDQLAVFSPKTTDDLKAYGNAFAQIYLTAVSPIAENPQKYNSNIDAIGPIYLKIAADLVKMKVPIDIAGAHLNIADDFAITADSFPFIDGQEKDPVRALLGLHLIQNTLQEMPQLFVAIHLYFKQNGIIFNDNEPGAMWSQIPDTLPAASTDDSSNVAGSQ